MLHFILAFILSIYIFALSLFILVALELIIGRVFLSHFMFTGRFWTCKKGDFFLNESTQKLVQIDQPIPMCSVWYGNIPHKDSLDEKGLQYMNWKDMREYIKISEKEVEEHHAKEEGLQALCNI